jgi:hypothetical protein
MQMKVRHGKMKTNIKLRGKKNGRKIDIGLENPRQTLTELLFA